MHRFKPKIPKNPQLARDFKPLLVSVNDTMALLGLSKNKIYKLLKANELERIKVGKKTMVPLKSLHAFIERHTVRPARLSESRHMADSTRTSTSAA
jgi:excisionase family DNA binding protein